MFINYSHFLRTARVSLVLAILALGISTHASAQTPAADRPLAPGDQVQITVAQDSGIHVDQPISKDGFVSVMYIGSVQIAGLSPQAAATKISDALYQQQYIRNAQVRVAVAQYAEQDVTVLGPVNRPGDVKIPNNRPLDLLEAIASAGGATPMADLGNIKVRRTTNGNTTSEKVDLKSLEKGNRIYPVQAGDTIIIGSRIF